MHDNFYVNDNYPLSTDVFDVDGVTPVLPISASVDILNQVSGDLVVSNGACQVASGVATYFILSGSDVAQNAGRYVGYMRVQIDTSTARTIQLPFDVLDKASMLPIFRWRAKVADSAPDLDHIDDAHAREWIDQAVAELNRRYDTGYVSVLGAISPTPDANTLEFITRVAALMARTAWWAGKGTYRDGEISFDATPFASEWARIEDAIQRITNDGWFDADLDPTMYNRDKVFYDGIKYDSPDYWWRTSTETDPDTEIPI